MSEVSQQWIDEKKAIPFEKGLPKEFQVHDEKLICPSCKGEMFGRCLCCQCYFCHGKCAEEFGGIYDEEDLIEALNERPFRHGIEQ